MRPAISGLKFGVCIYIYIYPKTNMEPENEALEEEIPMKNHHF